MKHGGDIVASTLKQHNIKHIFTLCGGHISPILVSCSQNDIKDISLEVCETGIKESVKMMEDAIKNGATLEDFLPKKEVKA